MEKKKGGELICRRPDSIVEARFKLTKKQNDIIDMVFATIENDDNLEYEINLHKYAKLYNIQNRSNIYGEVKKAVKSFEGKGFAIVQKISDTKEDRDYFPWFARIKYRDGEGKITVELGKTLKGILLEVKRAVYYKLEYSINLNCIYSKRMYYYLKLYEDTGKRVDNLDALREKLECPESYKKYSLFKQNVLRPAYEEINGNSDISFEYGEVKQKNKVTGLIFKINTNRTKNKAIEETCVTSEGKYTNEEEKRFTGLINEVKSIFEENIEGLEAKSILDTAKGNINIIKEKYEIAKVTPGIKGIVGWMCDAIKRDYQQLKGKVENGSFNDYEQRSYDYDKLEKALLGWDITKEDEVGEQYQQSTIKR